MTGKNNLLDVLNSRVWMPEEPEGHINRLIQPQ